MSASVGEGGSNQDVELNLAPIIDCFTVLITYLLVTASFLTLSAVDVGAAAHGAPSAADVPPGPPPLTATLQLKDGNEIDLQLKGGEKNLNIEMKIASLGNEWDVMDLDKKLKELQETYPTLTEISVSADSDVVYKDVVKIINEIQNVLPKVFISG